jgi:hypothetical protein
LEAQDQEAEVERERLDQEAELERDLLYN